MVYCELVLFIELYVVIVEFGFFQQVEDVLFGEFVVVFGMDVFVLVEGVMFVWLVYDEVVLCFQMYFDVLLVCVVEGYVVLVVWGEVGFGQGVDVVEYVEVECCCYVDGIVIGCFQDMCIFYQIQFDQDVVFIWFGWQGCMYVMQEIQCLGWIEIVQ